MTGRPPLGVRRGGLHLRMESARYCRGPLARSVQQLRRFAGHLTMKRMGKVLLPAHFSNSGTLGFVTQSAWSPLLQGLIALLSGEECSAAVGSCGHRWLAAADLMRSAEATLDQCEFRPEV